MMYSLFCCYLEEIMRIRAQPKNKEETGDGAVFGTFRYIFLSGDYSL